MARTTARKRSIPRCRAYGKEYGQGPRQVDAKSGWEFPQTVMVKQHGQWVPADPSEGSYDMPDDY